MRRWTWAAGTIVIAAVLALAAVWALREANVIRWGATGAALDRIEAAQDRIEALENQAPPAAPSLAPVLDRIAILEDRIDALDERAAQGGAEANFALAPILDRIEALEDRTGGFEQQARRIGSALDRIATLERQLAQIGPSEEQFIVVNADWHPDPQNQRVRACITYTVPGGLQEHCEYIFYENGDVHPASLPRWRCHPSAVIGEPLPACWR